MPPQQPWRSERLGAPQRWYPHRCAHRPLAARIGSAAPPPTRPCHNHPPMTRAEPKLTGLTTHVGWRASTKRPPSSSGSRNQEYLMHLASRLRRSGVSSGEDPEGNARFSLDRFRKFIVLILFLGDACIPFPLDVPIYDPRCEVRMNQQRRVDIGSICFAVILLFELFVIIKLTKTLRQTCSCVRYCKF